MKAVANVTWSRLTKKQPVDEKIGMRMLRTLRWIRPPAAGIGALTLAIFGLASSAAAQVDTPHSGTAVTCTNPVSGASWQILIDYNRSTVDSIPARISDTTIVWHDPKDSGNYTLDRKSGNLTVVIASSTGGYFLYDRCKLDK
jgi:hypothetical protein